MLRFPCGLSFGISIFRRHLGALTYASGALASVEAAIIYPPAGIAALGTDAGEMRETGLRLVGLAFGEVEAAKCFAELLDGAHDDQNSLMTNAMPNAAAITAPAQSSGLNAAKA